MKKKIFSSILSLLTAIVMLVGCHQPTTGNSTDLGKGDSSGTIASEVLSSDKEANIDSSVDSNDSTIDSTGNNGDCEEEHTDADNDERCDVCGESVTVTFDFFAINDLHGKFDDSDTQPGVDELTTYLKNARAENKNTVLLSSGDMWQGSSESNFTKGAIITEWMNELDFAAMTLGNHEYDWGEDAITENLSMAKFPFLALNIFNRTTNQLAEYCQPSLLIEQSNVKIGVIGAIGNCYSSISADKVSDVYFKTGSQLTALVKKESEKLRQQGADCIVYSIHGGYGQSYGNTVKELSDSQFSSYYDVALSEGYVDLVFEAHSHQRYVLKDSKGVYHLQDGGDNDGISHAELKINYANENCEVLSAEFIETSVYAPLSDDPVVEKLMKKYSEQIEKASRVLGMNDEIRYGNDILDLCAELYYQAGVEKWGSKYDIVLGGGYMSVRSPYDLSAGQILYGDLMSILPFDNALVLCSVSGSKLRSQFFETSNANYHIGYGDYGESVRANIQDNATYYIVTDTYSSQFAPNGLTEIERYDNTTYARDLLAKYIEAGGWTADESERVLTSIPDLLAIGKELADNASTKNQYYVKGTVTKIASTTWGNLYITDEEGNTFYIYGVYDTTGTNRYDVMTDPPQEGDTIVLKGKIKKYVTSSGSVIIEMENGKVTPWE